MDLTPSNATEQRLRERSERLGFLSYAASALLSASDPDAFLARIYERLATLLDLELYVHYSLSPDGKALELRASRGFSDRDAERLRRLALGEAVCGKAAMTRKPVVVSDVQASQGAQTALIRSLGITAYACHPLIANGQLFGTLSFGTTRRKTFTEESVGLIRAVSDLVATAINRRQTEHALRESEELNRAFFEQAGIATAETGLDGRLLRVNKRYCDLVGYSAEELRSMNFADLTHPEDREFNEADFQRLLRGEVPQFTVTKRYVRKDGRVIWVEATGTLCRDAAGRPLRILGVVEDITGRRQLEQERARLLDAERAARAEAERASLMKDEFLATVSHELRTPLNAMLGWAQLLMRGERDAATVREGLSIIERNAKAQSRLIADLLDMSRILSGKLQLELHSVELSGIVAAVLDAVRPTAKARDIALEFTSSSERAAVQGDPDRLQQAIWNLLSNAVKFTRPGGTVDVHLRRTEHQAELAISDTGQGIAPELLPHVFDRFRQGDPSASRRHGGLGLGLAIVRQLVEMQGGRVRAESDGPGRGATFTVCLPLAEQGRLERAAPAEDARDKADLAGLTVLAVDDEPDSLSVVRRVLEDSRARVITASSAEEALALLEREHADVLVSDIAMPGVDGYELIRRLRTAGGARESALPAAALTAYVRPQDRSRVLEAGYDAHLSKPVQEAELVATVRALAERCVASASRPAS